MATHGIILDTPKLSAEKSLKTLVENRTIHSLNHCELNLFETYKKASLVPLKFNDLVVTSMLRGKKRMHIYEDEFDYLPGQTVIIPAHTEMRIDFPEATFQNPTQCLALTIDHTKINEILNFLNEKYPKEGHSNFWQLTSDNYFFYNNRELATTINKLISVCMSTSITKDAIADLTLQELLIQIIQIQSVNAIHKNPASNSNNLIYPVISFIRANLTSNLSMKKLMDITSMSKASFYRFFKKELGISPVEFVLQEKIKYAKQLLTEPNIQINQVSYESGFDDCNYFIRMFKKHEGITPKQYQKLCIVN
ncbi:AraC family transcriptional regulator [Flavobacterium sp. '19STA2R22 D10 B1']|uniref:AraC family transcriptional regulator n=1 Tax=Flavobacterium aerium TaxID=3037261 RepID=UPI00278C3EBF|nr:AraC family transcriptional regulator [Flavobacterium sp. '19STA2R22 D10 B1']